MTGQTFTLDMSMMFAVHDALRRDLEHVARVAAATSDDPKEILRTALGWEMFKTFLRVHHTAEDVTVWGVMDGLLQDRPDDQLVLDAMEAEHAAIDPMLLAIDASLADREADRGTLGDRVDALTTSLSGHLRHEEAEGLRLIDSTLTPAQWKTFSEDHRARIGTNAQRYLPWLLDGASPQTVEGVLGKMPEPLQQAYASEWRTAYEQLTRWPTDH